MTTTDKPLSELTSDQLIDELVEAENVYDLERMAAIEAELVRREIER